MGTTNCKLFRRNSIKSDVAQNPSSSSHVTSDHGNWNDLPKEILISILALLPSIADLACAASVSRLWNSAAVAASNNQWAPQRPPLILTSYPPETPFKPTRCYLTPLESCPTSKPYYISGLSFQILANSLCVGRHFSKLILVNSTFIILHDVFSGEQIKSPKIASLKRLCIDFATLTASLHSSSLSLVLVVAHEYKSGNYYVFSWEPNGSGNRDGKFFVDTEIESFALFKDQVYYVDRMRRVGVVEFEPNMSCRLLGDISMENLQIFYWLGVRIQKLVECDGELLIVLFIQNPNQQLYCRMRIEVYKLDLEKRKWVKKEKLNNWCLFIDTIGKMGFSCKDPERWGGRSNCIYAHGPGCIGYGIYPLNDETDMSLIFSVPNWPCPIWVYPSIKSVEKVGSENS